MVASLVTWRGVPEPTWQPCFPLQVQTSLACSAVSGSLVPGPVPGPRTPRQITASVQVSPGHSSGCRVENSTDLKVPPSGPLPRLRASLTSGAHFLSPQGLSRRVLLTNVVTGHRQSYGTSSDVLAQQFAMKVGWVRKGIIEHP